MKNSGLLLACLLAFTLLFASPAYPTEIIREMPANAVVDEVVTVVLLLDMVTVGEKLVYTETIPSGFSFGSWEIDGSEESASQIIVNVQGDQYTWEFTPSEEFVILNYIAFAPQEPGNFIFRGYMEDNGIGYNDQAAMQITAEAVDPCGDGVCDIDEDESICPVDCSSLGSIEGELEITLTPDMIESIEYGDGTTPEVQEMGQSIEGVGEETPSQGQAQASNLLDTSTTPPPASTASAEDIFARKKTGPDPKVIVLLGASLAVLGLTVYGIYAQINKKKSGASANPLQQARDTAEEVKETLERMRSRTLPKNAPPAPSPEAWTIASKDFVGTAFIYRWDIQL